MLGFGCIILLGIGEAAVFSGGFGLYIFAGMPLLLIRTDDFEYPNISLEAYQGEV